jgi:ATP-binding cassette subfamily D (ALD) protein 3
MKYKNTDDKSISPYAALKAVSMICFFHHSNAGISWLVPVLSVLFSIFCELLSFSIMKVISDFYLSITSFDRQLFVHTAEKALILVIAISLVKSFQTYYSALSALLWRNNIVSYVHLSYLASLRKNQNNMTDFSSIFDTNPEQRVSQDADKLATELSKVFEKFFLCPILILFYSYYLYWLLGFLAPLCCFVYFSIGALISIILSRSLVGLVIIQEGLEGGFRRVHSNLLSNLISIALLDGAMQEISHVQHSFTKVIENSRRLVFARLKVNIFLNFHSYLGSIGICNITTSLIIIKYSFCYFF